MKRTRLKRKSMKPIKRLKAECDKLYQEIGRKLYKECMVCGEPMSELHHVFPKSRSMNLRYSLSNGANLCRSCHYKHHLGDPSILARIIKERGQEWYEELEKQSRVHCHVNKIYFSLQHSTLSQYLQSLEHNND